MFSFTRSQNLTKSEQARLLNYARRCITAKLCGEEAVGFENQSQRYHQVRGVFVTLLKHNNLRGCIGFTQSNFPLYQTVREVAEAAAFNDPRFPPLKNEELAELMIEISVLSPLRNLRSVNRIKVKRHGLMIKLEEAKGLLLPQVAARNNWNRETFLEHVCIKAGLERDAWKEPNAEIMFFDAQVFKESS